MGHIALNRYYRFDHAIQQAPSQSPQAYYTSQQSAPDENWYPDTSTTHHLTSDLSKFTLSADPYNGPDQMHVGDGSGLNIDHIGSSLLCTSAHSFVLKHLLHVPHITKNLLSVSQFALDNSVFF